MSRLPVARLPEMETRMQAGQSLEEDGRGETEEEVEAAAVGVLSRKQLERVWALGKLKVGNGAAEETVEEEADKAEGSNEVWRAMGTEGHSMAEGSNSQQEVQADHHERTRLTRPHEEEEEVAANSQRDVGPDSQGMCKPAAEEAGNKVSGKELSLEDEVGPEANVGDHTRMAMELDGQI
jgi:hypothetical protein